ncbi:MAG: T9SS type A sorting domain-containing protein [Flavobacteriales bacterium]
MQRRRRFAIPALLIGLVGTVGHSFGQGGCLNEDQYPPEAITPAANGTVTTISTCSFELEHSVITGILAGANYEFTSSSGSYITVRQDTYDGPIVGEGYSPLTVLTTANTDLFSHWNVDDQCSTFDDCVETTVQLLLDCEQPAATVSFGTDCDLGEFTIILDITSIGDGSSVSVSWDVDGSIDELTGLEVGVVEFGPFPIGSEPLVVVHHESDALCDLDLGALAPITDCPIDIICGEPAITTDFCYVNGETRGWTYVADAGGSLVLTFLAGSIESSNFDQLTIYDGPDNTGTPLYSYAETDLTDLAGVSAVSTTGALHMELIPDGFGSCDDGTTDPWTWNVVCLNCEIPEVTATVADDCPNNQFSINLEIGTTGDGSTVAAEYTVNGGAVTAMPGLTAGTTVLGPFTVNDEVAVVVAHESDPNCNVDFGILTDLGTCPNIIVCGAPALEENYCPGNNDLQEWVYQSSGTGTMRLRFTAGSIESSTFDDLAIYDGIDATGPLLYEHTITQTEDLTGLTVFSTSGSFYMTMSSDVTVSCADGSTDEWFWEVVCLDCELPVVGAGVVEDCANNQFSINVEVASTGDAATVNVVYTVNGGAPATEAGVGVGQTVIGPFTINDNVDIVIEHGSNSLCDLELGTITDSGACPTLIECGGTPLTETYCYDVNESPFWFYSGDAGTGALRLTFNAGVIQGAFSDGLEIYDGVDNTGIPLFINTANGNFDLTGLVLYANSGSIYMQLVSDAFGSCATNGFGLEPWEWEVACLQCNLPEATATIIDDCPNNEFSIAVDVTSLGDGSLVNVVYSVNGGADQSVDGVGVEEVVIGPFVLNDIVAVTVAHENNPDCDLQLGELTDTGTCPTLVDCGTDVNDNYCPGNDEDLVYYYQGTGTFPLGFLINSGTMETCCDEIHVYDGGDINAPELTPAAGLTGNLAGVFFSSSNPENRLTFRIISDISVSCADGDFTPIDWTVFCLDCIAPTATFNIVQDCANFQYFVDVEVTGMGTDTDVEIVNDGGADTVSFTTTGTYQVGPFVSGTPVNITLVNDLNDLCNVISGELVNPICPVIVCGATPLVETYCYTANDDMAWAYELPSAGTLRLTFQRGTIESTTFEDLTIYDGPDNTSPVLFDHTNTFTTNLGPAGSAVNNALTDYYTIDVIATGTNLYMEMSSDGSVQCGTTATYDPWEWTVYCDGCAAPGVSYNLVPDCFSRVYTAEVIITTDPPAEGVLIVNTMTDDSLTVNTTGVYNFGPYPVNDTSVFAVTSLDDPLCFYLSDSLTYASDSCIIRSCGFDNYSYCYGNDEDRWYTFQSLEPVPTTIGFLQGQLPTGDRIVVYNGRDENAAVLYQGNNGGNLTGFAINSQNAENIITLRIQSDAAGSCDDGQVSVPLQWYAACGAVGVEESAFDGFSLYPNPTNGALTINLGNGTYDQVQVRVLDMSGRVVIEAPLNITANSPATVDMSGLMNGQYMVQLVTDKWVKTQQVQVTR